MKNLRILPQVSLTSLNSISSHRQGQQNLRYNLAFETVPMTENAFLSKLPPSVLDELLGPVAQRLLPEYGSVFVAAGGATPPDKLVYADEADVERIQRLVEIGSVEFGDIVIEL